jgi:putative FmdB family regulatory protein
MPIYEYRCERGHTFEVMQRMSDDPVAVCEACTAPVERVFHPVAVHFKGSGFYNTDYGTRKRSRERGEAGEGKAGEGASGEGKASAGTSNAKSDSDSGGASKKSSDKSGASASSTSSSSE